MPEFLLENLPTVGGVYYIQDLIANPFFSDQFSPRYEPISHADIVFHHLDFFPYINGTNNR